MPTILFPNEDNNEWINKYNELVRKIKCGEVSFPGGPDVYSGKLTLHHIIPKSIRWDLVNNPDNHVWVPFKENMDLHYYLWKANPRYAKQLWFGCVFGRKRGLWDLPGGYEEYKQLSRDRRLK